MATDFDDITPDPDPAPKKHYMLTPATRLVPQPFSWPAGTTFQAALAAALPAVVRNRVNVTDFQFNVTIDAREI